MLKPPDVQAGEEVLRKYLSTQQGAASDCSVIDGRLLSLDSTGFSEEALDVRHLFEVVKNILITFSREYSVMIDGYLTTSGPASVGNCLAGRAAWSARELLRRDEVMNML